MNDPIRHRFWNGVLHCERQHRYYDGVRVSSGRCDTTYRTLAMLGLIGAGAALTLSGGGPLQIILGGISALLGVLATVLGLIGYSAEKAILSRAMAGQYSLLGAEWKRLYREVRQGTEAPNTLQAQAVLLEKMQVMLDAYSDHCGWTDRKLNRKISEEAYKSLEYEFANAEA